MSITLSLATSRLDAQDLQALTNDLCLAVNRETDIDAQLGQSERPEGAKGDPVTIAAIVLALITSGAAAKLFDVFRTYVERESSLEIHLEREDGQKLSIDAVNLKADRFQETIKLAEQFLESPA